jgi:hypothetical protein
MFVGAGIALRVVGKVGFFEFNTGRRGWRLTRGRSVSDFDWLVVIAKFPGIERQSLELLEHVSRSGIGMEPITVQYPPLF